MPDIVAAALATWKDINFSELQKTLDGQGIEIVDNQKVSLLARKALADKTKEFRKIPDADKLAAFKTLLKAYQTEIDNLTQRSKFSENAFLNVYKVIAEAPDPYPLLEAAVDQTVKASEAKELETGLHLLRIENSDLKKRVAELSSVDTAKKKAEERAEVLETKMEDMIREKVAQKENELNATYDEKIRNYEEREQDLQRQLLLTKSQLRDLRLSNDSTQAKLLDHSQRLDQGTAARLAEVDIIAADLERANSRVATVERRNEILRAEIEAIRSGNDTSDRVKTLQSQIAQLESDSERLSHLLETQKQLTVDTEAVMRRRTVEFERDVEKKALEADQLRTRLRQYVDYDEIKRELEIMKYVEFAGLEEEEEMDGGAEGGHVSSLHLPSPNAEKANAHPGKSLEALLATKNRRLLEELTKFRILHSDLETSLRDSQEQLTHTSAELEKQRTLNEKLENDIFLSMGKQGTSTPSTSVNTMPGSENVDVAVAALSLQQDLLADLEAVKKKTDSPARNTPIPFTSSADTSILPIVTSQRDRFRQRNAELEEELRKQYQAISELRAEIKTLQADNLKLYEKVRYMQSYREEAASRPPISQLNPLPSPNTQSGRGNDDFNTYRIRYEEAMNPFEAFRGREATRAYQALNPIERGVLGLTRSILGNRRARMFFVFYAAALHLLVMFTAYECTSTGMKLERRPGPHQR